MLKVQKIFIRSFVILAILLLGTLAVSAQDPVTITFWSPFTGPDGQVIEKMVNDFNATAGPEAGVTVELLIVPWDEYYTKLTVAMASSQAPNLSIAHSHRVSGFAEEGTLLEFTPEVMDSLGIVADNYIPALWNAGEYEGARYALPIDAFPRHLFYNKTVFENAGLDPETPPATLQEVLDDAAAIKASASEDTLPVFIETAGSGAARNFYAVFWQFAPNLLAEDGKSVSPDFIDAATKSFEVTTSFIDQGYASATPGDWVALFAQDKVGIAFSQITNLLAISQVEGLQWGAGVFPVLGDQPATFALGHNFILPAGNSQDEAHVRGSLTFIDWFGKNGFEWAAGGKVPASFTVLDDPEFPTLEAQAVAASQMDYMNLPPIIPQQPEIDRIVQENAEAIYGGQSSIADAVQRMADEINALLG
ncbi:MAG: extracellular solute-binding protein [Anaerolineae bacterium]|nr:extracellular solute-binding protein [Anaerolineae bacterium]